MSFIHNFNKKHQIKPAKTHPPSVIIGRFPPIEHAQSIEATRLAYTYFSAQHDFTTITDYGRSTARMKLLAKNRKIFMQNQNKLIKLVSHAPHTTVFCSLFLQSNLQTTTIKARTIERIRLIRFLWTILLYAKELTLVRTEIHSRWLLMLVKIANRSREKPIRLLSTTGAAQRITQIMGLPNNPVFSLKDAIEKLTHHSETQNADTPKTPPATPTSNLSIYGLPDSTTGIGQNARMSQSCFRKFGLSPRMVNIDNGAWQQNHKTKLRLKRPVILHHTNADRIEHPNQNDAYNIGFLLWELDKIPLEHKAGLAQLDEIWTPSEFVAQAYRNVTNRSVICMKKGIKLYHEIPAAKIGQHFTCLNVFDFHSSVERKNPIACARAFQLAFPKKTYPNCKLIIKTTRSIKKHWGDPNQQMKQLYKLAFWDRRISIVERTLDPFSFHKLIANADVIISTHRAEGFGYIPAYALGYGRPLVVTDFGGTQDFCTQKTSFPVRAKSVLVPAGHSIYPITDAKWADVEPIAVAQKLRWIFGNTTKAKSIAQMGQSLIKTEYSLSAQTKRYQARLRQLNLLDIGC